MQITKTNTTLNAVATTLVAALVGSMLYMLFEPAVMNAATESKGVIVVQEIGAEISFASPATTTVNMDGVIGGATGGTQFGSTTVSITTNDTTGYNLTIQFDSANGMEHAGTASFIDYYGTTTPDYAMGLGANTSGFAYSASSTNVVQAFRNNGSSCNQAAGTISANECWVMHGTPTSANTVVNSSGAATSEVTEIGFQVQVGAGSGLPNGFYYATTTITANTNS